MHRTDGPEPRVSLGGRPPPRAPRTRRCSPRPHASRRAAGAPRLRQRREDNGGQRRTRRHRCLHPITRKRFCVEASRARHEAELVTADAKALELTAAAVRVFVADETVREYYNSQDDARMDLAGNAVPSISVNHPNSEAINNTGGGRVHGAGERERGGAGGGRSGVGVRGDADAGRSGAAGCGGDAGLRGAGGGSPIPGIRCTSASHHGALSMAPTITADTRASTSSETSSTCAR